MYKNILAYNRLSFNENNLTKYIVENWFLIMFVFLFFKLKLLFYFATKPIN